MDGWMRRASVYHKCFGWLSVCPSEICCIVIEMWRGRDMNGWWMVVQLW